MNALIKEALAARVLKKEGQVCGSCGDPLASHTALTYLYLTRPLQDGRNTPPAMTDTGQYAYWPYFFHQECWEKAAAELAELSDGTPSHIVGGTVVGECCCCGSHILPGELSGVTYDGQLVLSERAPNGMFALEFIKHTDHEFVCSVCMNELNLNILEGLWGHEHLLQGNECPEGTQLRCWRYGECDPSKGTCHMKGVD